MTAPMRETGTKVVATNRKARRNYDILDTIEAGLVLRGSRGEVDPRRQGPDRRRLRPHRRQRRDLAPQPHHRRLRLLPGAQRPRRGRASASCSSTATRSSGCEPGSTRSTCRSSRCRCTSRTAGPRSSWRWPRAARPTTSARPSPSATPTSTSAGRWPAEIGLTHRSRLARRRRSGASAMRCTSRVPTRPAISTPGCGDDQALTLTDSSAAVDEHRAGAAPPRPGAAEEGPLLDRRDEPHDRHQDEQVHQQERGLRRPPGRRARLDGRGSGRGRRPPPATTTAAVMCQR